ncbi:MAG: FKBP-type peptidyl-prolyl cis-trans isomerase [Protaetiibacter sp.]
MRIRPLLALSVVAVSAALLAGCSGSEEAASTASPSASATADLCSSAAASGSESESVTVEGEIGTQATATFTTPLQVTTSQRTVLQEGPDKLNDGDYVDYAFTVFDADDGSLLAAIGYTPGENLPQQITAEAGGQIFGCSGPGSRIVFTSPASEQSSALVYVLDVLSVAKLTAWGTDQPAVDGMPTVTLADDGTPSVEIPAGSAPTSLQIAVLKKGDGIPVESGDTTLLQYYGVDWSTGESFDSSWERGEPYSNQGNQYVTGFVQALEGQTVGSQVLVVIPPALAYGEKSDSNTNELAGETLVFVIDILATQHAAASQ